MSPDLCICGRPYVDHPDGVPPTPFYRVARRAAAHAIGRVIYWPGISDGHRRAIVRARLERTAANA